MTNECDKNHGIDLPPCATEFTHQVVRKMGYRRRAQQEVEAELTAHFEDELKGVADTQEREQKAQRLIEQFGDVKLLAILCRRAKKRCRPLWATTLVRTAQAAGVLLVLFVFYTAWFITGRPAPTVDYVMLLNQMGRPEITERDNAWPHYEKAIALLVGPDDELKQMDAFEQRNRPAYQSFDGLPQEAREAIEQWVGQNEAAWQEFVAASVAPYCQRNYACDPNEEEPWLMSILLPHLAPLNNVAILGIWRSRIELERGEVQQALDDCLAIARAALHWQTREFLIEQLVGIALSRIAHEEILAILHERGLSAAQLADLQRKVAALYPGEYPLIDLNGERLGVLDTIQRVFTDEGPGGGHLSPWAARGLAAMGLNEDYMQEAAFPSLTVRGMIHAGRDDTTAKADWMFDQQMKRAKLSPYERRTTTILGSEQILDSLPKYRYALIHMLTPALGRVVDVAIKGRSLHEATLTALTLQQYYIEKGSYPASLAELTRTGHLDASPADPYSNGSLAYKLTDDGFTLYSLGPDFDDDGGTMGTDRKGRPRLWADNGDTVFWPPSP